MLELARTLAGPHGKIAAVDTEHGSLSKYADLYDFDVMPLDSYSPENFRAALDAAEAQKYAVFCCDSLSHFWVGKDGALEYVDTANKRQRDQQSGWRDWRPHERAMVDRMLASPCHVLVTMRTKNDYVEEVNAQGKKVRRKIGLAPVQREGLEYEFDLVGYMDDDNTFIVDKTRCPAYAKKAITQPGEKDFAAFRSWLAGVDRATPPTPIAATPLPPVAHNAAKATPAELAPEADPRVNELWRRMTSRAGFTAVFQELRRDLCEAEGSDRGEELFLAILSRFGRQDPEEFVSGANRSFKEAQQCVSQLYQQLAAATREEVTDD